MGRFLKYLRNVFQFYSNVGTQPKLPSYTIRRQEKGTGKSWAISWIFFRTPAVCFYTKLGQDFFWNYKRLGNKLDLKGKDCVQYGARTSPSSQENRHLGTPQPAHLGNSGRREERHELFSKLKLKTQTSNSHCMYRNCMAETSQNTVQSSYDPDIASMFTKWCPRRAHLVG